MWPKSTIPLLSAPTSRPVPTLEPTTPHKPEPGKIFLSGHKILYVWNQNS